MENIFDVVVVGGGHAGLEAATASCRKGAKTALITISKDDIGEMSCNPAIGGLGKGHIVREVDALDGVMGLIADRSGIQFRVLNASKGSAVQGPRTQSDRKLYKNVSHEILDEYIKNKNLHLIESKVENIILNNNKIEKVILENGQEVLTKAVVLTTGTFLGGVIHIGSDTKKGGRYNAEASFGLSKFLKDNNFSISRLKTGTPARLDKSSINFDILEEQYADEHPKPFSFLNTKIDVPQISCYITETNTNTHKIIKDNLSKSAMLSGNISGVGPRYCPSIEDKVERFKEKERHQIFLEPEGLDSNLIYPNGISTSLPEDIQLAFLRTIKGLENVKIVRYGYAIEYDFVNPQELSLSLQTKKVKGLFLAGQINGTTGYEEAAGQGLLAGCNAAVYSQDSEDFLIIKRSEGYIGVMIDDLIHQGVSEPYRMFSSRAEYRMLLRADNADQRLTEKGYNFGVVSEKRYTTLKQKTQKIINLKEKLEKLSCTPNKIQEKGVHIKLDGIKRSALNLLTFSDITVDNVITIFSELENEDRSVLELINSEAKYSFYLKKQQEEIRVYEKEEALEIPKNIDYKNVDGLSTELIEKFSTIKPETLGSAMRVKGATPSSAVAILTHIRKNNL